jgi:dipeptidyl aminopeptidase/acylaminoacyl peptidase
VSGRRDSNDWELRFRAPDLDLPSWARHAPDRLTVATNESGAWQVYAWDRAAGTRRRVTDNPIGILAGDEDVVYLPTPDGERIVWFQDPTGDETARWVVQPFDAPLEEAAPEPLLPGVPDAWTTGIVIGDSVVAVGTGRDEGFDVYVSVDGAPAQSIHHHAEIVAVADLSRDEALLALEHAENGDSMHFALRVVRPATGENVADLWDGPELGLHAAAWSPVAGDQRLAIVHERGGRHRPGIWDLGTGERTDIDLDLPGDVGVFDWWPDASALLLVHEFDGRSELYRLTVPGYELSRLEHPTGTISGASVRPDGSVWYRHAAGDRAPELRSTGGGGALLSLVGEAAPPGRPYMSWSFRNPNGDRVHGFYATPPGEGPFPVIMDVHGGPTWAYADDFRPSVQAWVDQGFAVGMVNYRGSTGYGGVFRDALTGNPGFPETEDVLAGLDDLIEKGIADPARAVVAGNSWGGYITLMSLGLHPDRYALGLAGVPVADYPAAYEDEAELLRAYDRTLFGGGGLEDLPELYVERSPMTYIENVRAPVLILAGDNDSRCPIRQVLNYCNRLTELGREFELYRFEAGHGSMVMDEQIRQMRLRLDYALARIDTGAAVAGERA